MKKITVLSDTHGNRTAMDRLGRVLEESDMVIHLGDTSGDGNYLKKYNKNLYVLNGNCDVFPSGENELVIPVEGLKIFACHGHRYSVKSTLQKLAARAEELGCGIALYGHTHRAAEENVGGVTAINPGTMNRYSRNSYCYLVVNGGNAVCKIVYTDGADI